MNVQRWLSDEQRLRRIFRATLVNWAAESTYEFVSSGSAQNIQLTYPWFGVFDHKLLAHPRATQLWSYDPVQDRFIEQSESIEAPKNVRQEVNAAEELLRRGDFEKALAEYERAWSDKTLPEEDLAQSKADFRSFARFRQGQLLALLGREADARKALADVQKIGGDLGKLIAAFLKNYTGSDAAIRAWAGLENEIDLYEVVYHDDVPSNLGFPFDASAIYFKGQAFASYLDAHPDAASNREQVFSAVRGLGLKLLGSLAADLDGDAKNEFLFVTQEGGASPNQRQDLWLVYRGTRGGRWLARDIFQSENFSLDAQVMPLPARGSAVRIKQPNAEPPEIALTWDHTRVIYLDAATLNPRAAAESWPVLGAGRIDTEF